MDSSSESDTEKTIADDLVVTKYKMAGKMSNSKLLITLHTLPFNCLFDN